MSYASVAAHNAPPPSQQPHPDPSLLTTEDDVSGGSLPDVSRNVNVAPHDFKSNPQVSFIARDCWVILTLYNRL